MDQNGKFDLFSITNKKNNLYLLGVGVACSTNTSNVTFGLSAITKTPTLQSILWHHHLGHLHLHAIKQMQNFQLVKRIGGATTSLPICEGCIFGKHHVSNFPFKSNSCSTKLLELVHMILCDPM
jgi:hypothetical protein